MITLFLIIFIIYITGVIVAWFKLYWHYEDAISKCYSLTEEQKREVRRCTASYGCWRSWMPVIFLRK